MAVVLLLATSGSSSGQAALEDDCTQPGEPRTPRLLAAEMTCMINEVRRARDLRRLRPQPQLRRSALRYARHLVREDRWTHFGDDTPAQRVARTGYLEGSSRWVVGEVLGSMRQWDPGEVVRSFLDSPSHRRVLLRPGYRDIGVGAVEGVPRSDAPGGFTVAINFGQR